jgi:hypothetical protein
MSTPDFWENWLKKFYEKVKDTNIKIPKNPNKVAVIIEPRKHPLLKYVIFNFMYFLAPKGFGLHIFCGNQNYDFITDITKELKGYVHITKLPYENLTEQMYNGLLTTSGIYERIWMLPEHILIFQTDTMLFSGELEEFFKFDFIGAPWKHSPFKGCNGGLSLRNREAIIRVCKNNPWVYDNEDGFFSYRYESQLKMPELKDKLKFSMETIWGDDEVIGLHAAYKFQNLERLKKLLERKWKEIFNEEINL